MGVILSEEEKPSLDELAHFGVKGMKWGVKKAYTERITKKTDRFDRVASGKGSFGDKARTLATTSTHDLAAGRGLKGAASIRSARDKAHLDRINNGHAKLKDVLRMVGTVSNRDIGKGLVYAKNAPN